MLMSGGDANGALAGGCGDSFPPPVGSDRSSSSIHSRACAQIVVCQGSSQVVTKPKRFKSSESAGDVDLVTSRLVSAHPAETNDSKRVARLCSSNSILRLSKRGELRAFGRRRRTIRAVVTTTAAAMGDSLTREDACGVIWTARVRFLTS